MRAKWTTIIVLLSMIIVNETTQDEDGSKTTESKKHRVNKSGNRHISKCPKCLPTPVPP